MKIVTNSAEETIRLGGQLGRHLKAGDVLGLIGELGSGKTTLVKGIASGLGVKQRESVSSPSFVLIKEYSGKIPLFHFDLYRLDTIKDIEYLGVEEYLFDKGVCVIEWAEKMRMLLPDYLQIDLTIQGENKREFKFFAHDKRYEDIIFRYLK
ncbi:MAG: tRNA (adenosine(37)-N6)-threonylcarbamoyltransferase complex ATPase subunit type 1 TsaE [Candidatus Omnitrophica bacterium]|nr:tRNA (adenosine(37)-N6)-threonylcarbamoyltransferase complex ATPase subunit type 1 TsaE [Candidatus Omnitrophota bacterium]MBU3933879.1 tRNA (adenosine(37)-N6)-threonylcarbamoyltransferase complex ATPase subunit type 1 TsaE [Candidatus Omnitrophota bacterium]MBU4141095.1 tRNA (adenosine(37)-N6)-threonylcarbamoyltransferase complex ATPase subunit type 1 TsaE [Candidatus Omnitrophota bacterium]